jgi:hypothetical protein
MNSVSSRSHAIFSVIIKQQMPEEDQTVPGSGSKQNVTSKFHFVDLAGSERVNASSKKKKIRIKETNTTYDISIKLLFLVEAYKRSR